MKAVVWNGKRDLCRERRSVDRQSTRRDRPGDADGDRGSDLHLYKFVPGIKAGDVLGHEFMGEIVATGPACEQVKVRDRVIVMCAISCGRCWFCKHELFSACDNSNPAGNRIAIEAAFGHAGAALFGYSHLYGGYSGGQAEYVRVPFADVGCVKVPSELTDEQVLMLTDVFPTGFMAAENCKIQQGDTIAVSARDRLASSRSPARGCSAPSECSRSTIPNDSRWQPEQGAIVIDETHGQARSIEELTGGRARCRDRRVGMEAHGSGIQAAYDRVSGRCDSRPIARWRCATRSRSVAGRHRLDPRRIRRVYRQVPDRRRVLEGLTLTMGQTHFHRHAAAARAHSHGAVDPSFVITDRVTLNEVPAMCAKFDAATRLHQRWSRAVTPMVNCLAP
jgi:threonine dehydrogenase-like Zn-dependent dehydrogenase